MPNDQEDATLAACLARVALKDRHAFDALYKLTSGHLFAVSLRMMRNRSEAEDVLQEVYIRIWHRADSFRPGQARPISWLIAITRNLAIDKLRARTMPVAPIEMAEELPDHKPTPETAYAQSEVRAQINTCLEELDTKRAEAVRAAVAESAVVVRRLHHGRLDRLAGLLLDERVPALATRTLPHPAGRCVAATLADVDRFLFRHRAWEV